MIARRLGLGIAAVTTVDPPGVTTKVPRATANLPETLRARLITDLAGVVRHDEHNALSRALEIVGGDPAAAAALVDTMRPKAAALIEQHWPAIERVAAALEGGTVLTESDVDEPIGGSMSRLCQGGNPF